jgi:hypothetical protein
MYLTVCVDVDVKTAPASAVCTGTICVYCNPCDTTTAGTSSPCILVTLALLLVLAERSVQTFVVCLS